MNTKITSAWIALLLLAPLACSDGEVDPEGGFAPRYGFWNYTEKTILHNNCGPGGADGIDLDGPISVARKSGGFTVVPGYGPMFDCSLSGKSFTCKARPAEHLQDGVVDQPVSNGEIPDASSEVIVVTSGEFTSATRAQGSQKAVKTCEGPGCAATGITFPCEIEVAYLAAAVE